MSQQHRYNENQPSYATSKPMGSTSFGNMQPNKPAAMNLKKPMEPTMNRVALGEISQSNNNMGKNVEPFNMLKKSTLAPSMTGRVGGIRANNLDDNCMSDDTSVLPVQQHLNLNSEISAFMAEQKLRFFDPTMSREESEDPQMCSVYSEEIHKHLRMKEEKTQPNPLYMTRQSDINAKMREILIDWLVEVHLKFKLRQETLYLTVNIIDRFLDCRAVARSKLQLVGCTAMLIASKYEEIYAPEVQDFVFVSDKAYTRDHILAMEGIMLNVLEFYITTPYPIRFTERYLRLTKCNEEFSSMVSFLIELTLQDYKFIQFLPSMIASSAISLALHLSGQPAWSDALQEATGYTEAAIRNCVMAVWETAAKDNPKYRAVRKKYQSSKFHGVSKTIINPPPMGN